MRAAMGARLATGAVGVAMLGFGAWNLLNVSTLNQEESIGKWLVGGVVVHDGILAPIVFAAGALAWRLTGARSRRGLAMFLLAGGSVAIVALPSALRSGDNPNPTVTPLDYSRNLAIVLGGLAVCVLLYVLGGRLNDRRRSGGATTPEADFTAAEDSNISEDCDAVENAADSVGPEEARVSGGSEDWLEHVDDPKTAAAGQPSDAGESTDPGEPKEDDGIVAGHDATRNDERNDGRDGKLDGQG